MATEAATFLSIRPTAQQTFSNTPNSTDKASIARVGHFFASKNSFRIYFLFEKYRLRNAVSSSGLHFCYPPHGVTRSCPSSVMYIPPPPPPPSSFSSFLPLPSSPCPPPRQRERDRSEFQTSEKATATAATLHSRTRQLLASATHATISHTHILEGILTCPLQ